METPARAGIDAQSDPRTRYRPLIRTAHLIQRGLNTERTTPLSDLRTHLGYLADEFTVIDRIQRSLRSCEQRGWLVAGRGVQRDALNFVEEVRTRLAHIEELATPRKLEAALTPALSDIVRELQQIDDEFDDWSFDEGDNKLTVTSDNITLEDVDLGVFDIVLHINRLAESSNRAYSVEAQTPNRPVGNDAISHPHISDDALCAGEAAVPIRRALVDGRFCDFFLLVKGVIETYNPSSAYVKLENWSGIPCHDCGDRTDSEDLCTCHNCDNEFCPQCSSSCEPCSASRCNDCLSSCARCDISVCESCHGYCSACRKACCHECLNSDGLCTECELPEDEELDEAEPAITPVREESRNEVQPLQTPTPVPTQPF